MGTNHLLFKGCCWDYGNIKNHRVVCFPALTFLLTQSFNHLLIGQAAAPKTLLCSPPTQGLISEFLKDFLQLSLTPLETQHLILKCLKLRPSPPGRRVIPRLVALFCCFLGEASKMGQTQTSPLGLSRVGIRGTVGSPGLSAQGLDFTLLDELAAPQLLDLPVQVADLRHGPLPRRGSESGPPPPPHRTGVSWEKRRRARGSECRCGGLGGRLDSGAGLEPPHPGLPSHRPGDPQCPTALAAPPPPPLANSRRTPRSRAKDGGLEEPPTITAAATSARALGLLAFLLPSALGRRHRRFYFRPRRGN